MKIRPMIAKAGHACNCILDKYTVSCMDGLTIMRLASCMTETT